MFRGDTNQGEADTISVDFKECDCTPFIPSLITPNGDGINDQWVISHRCDLLAQVSVYNRYGTLIYHSDNYQDDWKGTYKSMPCPDGTYYYVVTMFSQNQKPELYKGNITILR